MANRQRIPDYKAFSIHHPAMLKPLRQGLVYLAARMLLWWAGRLSIPALQRIGRLLGSLVFRLSRRDRTLCRVQLEMALPELAPGERRRIARECLRHQGMTLLETMALPRMRQEGERWMTLENEDVLVDAHAKGQGVILVTAHCGNWELLPIALKRLRIKGVAMASTMDNKRLNRMIGEIRRFEYMDVAERGSGDSPRQLMNCLKRGEVLIMVNDVDIETNGVFVNFFGIPAHTSRGPAAIALKRETPVITYFDVRLDDGKHRIRFEEVSVAPALRDASPVQALTQTLNDRIEAHIRAHPEQWMWNHRRWKRRPS